LGLTPIHTTIVLKWKKTLRRVSGFLMKKENGENKIVEGKAEEAL